jgi:hypothetical protein
MAKLRGIRAQDMNGKWPFIGVVALLVAAATSTFGGNKNDALGNPQVMRTSPAGGATIPAGPVTLRVTYDRPMRPDSTSFVRTGKGAFPSCHGAPRSMPDKMTFEWDCTVEPGKAYAVTFNYGADMKFVSADTGVPAITYGIEFLTEPATPR